MTKPSTDTKRSNTEAKTQSETRFSVRRFFGFFVTFYCILLYLIGLRYIPTNFDLKNIELFLSDIFWPPEPDDVCGCRMIRKWSLPQNQTNQCGESALARGPGQKVLSYSFYGNIEVSYFKGIRRNLEGMAKFYPGYVMRVYHDKLDPSSQNAICGIFCELPQLDFCNVKLLDNSTGESFSKSFGMIWRFLPMVDPLVEEWHSRDLDSIPTHREAMAVRDWKFRDKTFHVMRDNKYHSTPILGGMWGMKNKPGSEEQRRTVLNEMLKMSKGKWNKGVDQGALSRHVWPWASQDAIIHDSYLCERYKNPGNRPFPTQRLIGQDNFVGSNGGQVSVSTHGECPLSCRPKEHTDWKMC